MKQNSALERLILKDLFNMYIPAKADRDSGAKRIADYENLSTEEAVLFFQLINPRYEHDSIILITNKPFGKWGEIMADDAVETATLDRLFHQ